MIELYGMGSPNVVKIYIALEEIGPALQRRIRLTYSPASSSTPSS